MPNTYHTIITGVLGYPTMNPYTFRGSNSVNFCFCLPCLYRSALKGRTLLLLEQNFPLKCTPHLGTTFL